MHLRSCCCTQVDDKKDKDKDPATLTPAARKAALSKYIESRLSAGNLLRIGTNGDEFEAEVAQLQSSTGAVVMKSNWRPGPVENVSVARTCAMQYSEFHCGCVYSLLYSEPSVPHTLQYEIRKLAGAHVHCTCSVRYVSSQLPSALVLAVYTDIHNMLHDTTNNNRALCGCTLRLRAKLPTLSCS
jgi:hypothetical protein